MQDSSTTAYKLVTNATHPEATVASKDDVEQAVIGFVRDWTRLQQPITPDTWLVDDLGIWGDDGDEFLMAFGKALNVDVQGFPRSQFFGTEGFTLGGSLQILKHQLRKERTQDPQLKVADLIHAARMGRFDIAYSPLASAAPYKPKGWKESFQEAFGCLGFGKPK